MGSVCTKSFGLLGSATPPRILILGTDFAGKTALLHRLKDGVVSPSVPTTGFVVETIHHKQSPLEMWEVGMGPNKALWQEYYPGTKAVIFVMDSSDVFRFLENRDLLQEIAEHQALAGVPIVVMANKQDLPDGRRTDEVAAALKLRSITTHPVYITGTSTLTGEGINESLDWILDHL